MRLVRCSSLSRVCIARCPHQVGAATILLAFTSLGIATELSAQRVQNWLTALQDPNQRRGVAYAAPDLRTDSVSAVRLLALALRHRDPLVRQYTAAALGDAGIFPRGLSSVFAGLLLDENLAVRAQAVVGLGKFGLNAVPALLPLLAAEVESGGVRPGCRVVNQVPALAATALGLVGSVAIDTLMATVPRLAPDRQTLVSFAISEMGWAVASRLMPYMQHQNAAVRLTAVRAVRLIGPAASNAALGLASTIANLLLDRAQPVRLEAALALAQIASEVPVAQRVALAQQLVRGLGIRQADPVQAAILTALGELKADAALAVPWITQLLNAPASATSHAAAVALGNIGVEDQRAARILQAMVRTGSAGAAQIAASSLSHLGDAGISSLVSVLRSRQESADARAAALRGLTEAALNDPELRQVLIRFENLSARSLGDPDPAVRAAGARLLGVIGGELAQESLVDALSDDNSQVTNAVVDGFAHLGPAAAGALMVRALGAANIGVRTTALRGLGRIGGNNPRTLQILLVSLDDQREPVRMAAVDGLAALGSAARIAGPQLLEMLDGAVGIEAGAIRRALGALSPLDTNALPGLRRLLVSASIPHRRLAAELLVPLGPAGRPVGSELRRALRDADPAVSRIAAEAILATDPPGPPHPEAMSTLYDAAVAAVLTDAKDALENVFRCPVPTALSFGGADLPDFPWPPPLPSSHDIIPREFLGDENSSLGDVHARLDHAVRDAGFGLASLYGVPGGFALATQVERLHPDGSPFEDSQRWTSTKLAPRSLGEYLAQLFLGKPGRFRMIAFVVTPQPNIGFAEQGLTEGAARELASGRGRVLPKATAELPFAARYGLVLVYHFERRAGQASTVLRPDPLLPRQHLETAGVWATLAR